MHKNQDHRHFYGCSLQHVAASSGSGSADLEKLCAILEAIPTLKYICLDVANGYSEYFVEFVKTVRGKFPKHTIMVRELQHLHSLFFLLLFCDCDAMGPLQNKRVRLKGLNLETDIWHLGWQLRGVRLSTADSLYPAGWERGDRGDGGGAHPLWC